jgi:beta-aspartyl-peptidase (threonine type)
VVEVREEETGYNRSMSKIALAIHGGAGTNLRSNMTPELEREYRDGLEHSLLSGWDVLSRGGSALDAVERAVCTLEDFHLFNAGRGSVFTHEGKNEMDASIMDGRTLDAGAVAFLINVKNPIKLARLVMERTPHILLAAEGANQFAKEMGVEFAPDEYFFTEHRWQQLLKAREEGVVQLDHTAEETELLENAESEDLTSEIDGRRATGTADPSPQSAFRVRQSNPKGTVGAVACDSEGNLAAATSTGGMTNKKFGRVGDTALIGAGTYADNGTCAISCTGHGEYFMSGVTAYDVAARMKYKRLDLGTAADEALQYLTDIGGDGGFIAVDGSGHVALPFNCDGMYRAYKTETSSLVSIYRD